MSDLSSLDEAIQAWTFEHNHDLYRTSNYEFERYSNAELDEVERRFGHPLPPSFRHLLTHYESLYLGERLFCWRRGMTNPARAQSLHMPARLLNQDVQPPTWSDELEHHLADAGAPQLLPRMRKFFPLSYTGNSGQIGLDLGYDPVEPPIVWFNPVEPAINAKYKFLARDLEAFLRLPELTYAPEDDPRLNDLPCSLDSHALEWYDDWDRFINQANMSSDQRQACEKAKTPHHTLKHLNSEN